MAGPADLVLPFLAFLLTLSLVEGIERKRNFFPIKCMIWQETVGIAVVLVAASCVYANENIIEKSYRLNFSWDTFL